MVSVSQQYVLITGRSRSRRLGRRAPCHVQQAFLSFGQKMRVPSASHVMLHLPRPSSPRGQSFHPAPAVASSNPADLPLPNQTLLTPTGNDDFRNHCATLPFKFLRPAPPPPLSCIPSSPPHVPLLFCVGVGVGGLWSICAPILRCTIM